MGYYEYEPLLNFKPGFNLWKHNYERFPFNWMAKRAIKKSYLNAQAFSTSRNVTVFRLTYPSNGVDIPFVKISPNGLENSALPTIIYYHGGGFICPLDTMMLNNASFYAEYLKINVLLPDYRLAPDFSSTIILSDCNNFFDYVLQNANALSVDLDKLIILGDSAGGFLATSTLIYAIRNYMTSVKGLFLIYPVTDDEIDRYDSMKLSESEWNKAASVHMWNLFRKKNNDADNELLDSYIPMKQSDYSMFPQTYIEVQEFDTLKDEGIALSQKLKNDYVPVTLKEIKGTYHGFDNMPDNPFVINVLTERCEILKAMLKA